MVLVTERLGDSFENERRGKLLYYLLFSFPNLPPTHAALWGRPCLEQILKPYLA